MAGMNAMDMKLSKIYPLLVAKAIRKGRSRQEVDRILADYLDPQPFDPGACTRGLYLRGVE